MLKFKAGLLGALTLGLGLMVANTASATVINIGGIDVPLGFAPDGFDIFGQLDRETLVLATGNELKGVGTVTDIGDGSNITFINGQGGKYLYDVFKGFIVDTVTPPTATTTGQITFTGGTLKYYIDTVNRNCTGAGCLDQAGAGDNTKRDQDIANAELGQLWLSLVPQAVDALGHTFVVTIPAGGTLNSFANASGNGALNVAAIGGLAGPFFDTCTFADPFAPGGCVDFKFVGGANSGASGDFQVSGHDTLKGNTQIPRIPEPGTLWLLGAGLLGLAGVRKMRARS